MFKKWFGGVAVIACGVLLAYAVSSCILAMEYFMFNPQNKNTMLACIVLVPLIVYETVYGFWYYWCSKKGVRDVSVYKGVPYVLVITAVVDMAVILSLIAGAGFLVDAWVHVFVSFVCTIFAFGIALFGFRPF